MATEVANLIARLRADATGYVAGIGTAIGANQKLQGSVKSTAAGMSQVGMTMSKYVSLPLLAVGVAAGKMSMDFETSMHKMVAIGGVSREEIGGLKDDILDMSGEVAQSPKALAEAMYFIVSAGVKASEATDVLRASAYGASAGLGDVETVARSVTGAVNAFAAQNLTAAQAVDILVAGAKDAAFEVDEMAASIGRVEPVAAEMGIGFDQVVAGLAALSQGNLDAHQSTTALLGILTQILHPQDDATEKWREMFPATKNAAGGLEQVRKILREGGLNALLHEMSTRVKGNEDALASMFPDVRGLIGALSLLGQDQAKVNDIFGNTANATGKAKTAFDEMHDSLHGKLATAMAELSVALIDLGDGFGPVISGMATAATKFGEAMQRIPGPMKVVLGVLAGIAIVVGPALVVMGSLARAVNSLMALWAAYAARQALATAATEASSAAAVQAAFGYQALGASAGTAAAGLSLMSGALIAVTAGLAAGTIGGAALLDWINGATPSVDNLTAALLDLDTARQKGESAPSFDYSRYAKDITDAVPKSAGGFLKSAAEGLTPGGANPQKAKADIEALNKTFVAFIASKGPQKAAEMVGLFSMEMTKRTGKSSAEIAAFFGPFYAALRKTESESKNKAASAGNAISKGMTAGAAATTAAEKAIVAYNAAMTDTTGITNGTLKAGREAAVALSGIGVAAQFAAAATVEGMSKAEIAVNGLLLSIQAGLDATTATDSLLDSFHAIDTAKKSASGHGAAGSSTQTATAAAIEQRSKELALRDAYNAVADAATAVKTAELSLAQARQSAHEATRALADAEKEYDRVLHGVAAGSREAIMAQLDYNDAKRAGISAALDVNDARRNIQRVANDKKMLDFAVEDARRKVAELEGKSQSSMQHWVQTTEGAKLQPIQPGPDDDPNALAKARIELSNALLDQAAAGDNAKRAQLDLAAAESAAKRAAIAANDAQRLLNNTLHGYAKDSKEAKDAQDALTNAWLAAISAANGVTSAEVGVTRAHEATETAALNLWRAEADLKGQLDSTSSSASGASDNFRAVAKATHAAEANTNAWAQKLADASGYARGTNGWTRVFVDSLIYLKNTLNPTGELARWLDDLIDKFDKLGKPRDITIDASSGGNIKHYRAAGGPVSAGVEYVVNEHGKRSERFIPSMAGNIVHADQYAESGGGRGGTTIVQKIELKIVALDPKGTADVVIPALRDYTNGNGRISGVRTD